MFLPFQIVSFYVDFSIPMSKYVLVRTRISLCLSSPDMYRIVFSCVVYSSLKALGKKGKKLTEKLANLQYLQHS